MSLKPIKTKLVQGATTYACYKITPPKPDVPGIEVNSLSDNKVIREPGDVIDPGETIEAELVYTQAIYTALKTKNAAAATAGTTENWGIKYADNTGDYFTAWVKSVTMSEAAKGSNEPMKILLTLGIADTAEAPAP